MRDHVDGDFPFANDFNAIVQALAGEASITSGCAVSDGGSNDLSLSITAGKVRIDGTVYSVSSQSESVGAADPDNDRYDIVVVGTDGTVDVVAGTANSTPTAPAIPADHALLAIVRVPAGASGITDGEIYGARGQFPHVSDQSAHHTPGKPLGSPAAWDRSGSWTVDNADVWDYSPQDGFTTDSDQDWSFTTTYDGSLYVTAVEVHPRFHEATTQTVEYTTDGGSTWVEIFNGNPAEPMLVTVEQSGINGFRWSKTGNGFSGAMAFRITGAIE